jgi:hypothetical protein
MPIIPVCGTKWNGGDACVILRHNIVILTQHHCCLFVPVVVATVCTLLCSYHGSTQP